MHKSKSFSHGIYHATLYAFRGTVADPQQNRTVHTEISGGGGVIPAAQSGLPGVIDPVRSTNTEYSQRRIKWHNSHFSRETFVCFME